MLKLVFGRSKSGKTQFIKNKICDLINNGEQRVLVIVPDQITFETERAFLSLLGARLSQRVLVLGFSRMCDYVFDATGAVRKPPADDCTKALLMSVALEEVKDNLSLYSDKALSTDLAKLMLSARKELSLSGNTEENVLALAADYDELTFNKLSDIYLASSAMDALLLNTFEDPDSELSVVADILKERRIFEDFYVFIDSYLSFTAPECEAISALMSQCREMYVTLSYDGISKEGLFSVSSDTALHLRRMAESVGLAVDEPILCTYNGFYKTEAINHLEENIYSDDKQVFGDAAESITIYRAKDRYDEIDFVAREIRRLLIEKNYRYNEIAVVGRDLSRYSSIISDTFDKYGISYFADKPHDITAKPLIRLISACFNSISSGFDKDFILSLLKTGLTSVSSEDISVFENYIYTWQLNYSSLLSDFTANPRGFADEFTFEDLDNLKRVENVRSLVINSLLSFKNNCSDSSAADISKGLYNLLIALGADKKIVELSDKLESIGELSASSEQIRLWEIFISTLDRTCNVLGDRVMTLKRYYELFMLQLGLSDISFIPKALDQVTVGDIERLRLGGRRCVFAIGAVDGEFPKTVSSSGIFTASQRSELSRLSILSDSDDEQNALREQYLSYYALTSASELLFVSFPASELNGEVNQQSSIISELDEMFPGCSRRLRITEDSADLLWAEKPAYDYFAKNYRNNDTITSTLRNYYLQKEEYRDKLQSLDSIINGNYKFEIKDKSKAERLFGTDMYLSASRIEKYHLCRFSYFCQYGLKAGERRKASIDALEYGSFVHYIMENFFKSFSKAQYSELDTHKIDSFVSYISYKYAELHFGGLSHKSARFVFLFNSVKEASCVLISHIIEELNQSEFSPVDFELDIGKDISAYRLELENGVSVTVTGKVDRADIYKKDDKTYIRIVDYKTGTKVFNLSDVIYGLNLQMLLYLSVIKNKGEERYGAEITPAGVLYMPSFVPTIEMAANDDPDKFFAERNKKLRMNGILLHDKAVLNAMENGLNGMYIPVSLGAKDYKGADNLATLEEFGAVFAHIDKLIAEMANELLTGKIDATPAACSYDACAWCPYSAVCIGRESNSVREIYKLDRDQILEELGINSQEVSQ